MFLLVWLQLWVDFHSAYNLEKLINYCRTILGHFHCATLCHALTVPIILRKELVVLVCPPQPLASVSSAWVGHVSASATTMNRCQVFVERSHMGLPIIDQFVGLTVRAIFLLLSSSFSRVNPPKLVTNFVTPNTHTHTEEALSVEFGLTRLIG